MVSDLFHAGHVAEPDEVRRGIQAQDKGYKEEAEDCES
jgi:hypothetical protein